MIVKQARFREAPSISVDSVSDAKPPPEFATLDIPAQHYRVFRLTLDGTSLYPQMQAAMRAIFETRIPAAGWELTGGPDLEIYEADFNPAQEGGTVEFWVPVKGLPSASW